MIRIFGTLLLAMMAAAPLDSAAADEFSDAQKGEIGQIVRQYLLEHPEILIEVSKLLEDKQKAEEGERQKKTLAENASAIFRSDGDFVAGNPNGDVTMVEFFDYNCGWCKKGMPEVLGLLESDKNLRLVMKEFPIFGADSEYAAAAALAAKNQGKYWELHLALLGHEGKVTKETVDQLAEAQGLDMTKLKADMESDSIRKTLDANQLLAQSLGINGTPAFIIDTHVVPGYLPKEGLAASIAEIRSAGGCQVC